MGISNTPFELNETWLKLLTCHVNDDYCINYENFSHLSLFHPEHGYYAQGSKSRVGKTDESDFYTASTHSEVFPQLVLEAAANLLKKAGKSPESYSFYELGAEPEQNHWQNELSAFKAHKIYRLGDAFDFDQYSVIYSNELFDAQPFHRWISVEGAWKPIHLKLNGNLIEEVIAEKPLTEEEATATTLLPPAPEFEYHLDLSTKAIKLMHTLCQSNWKGLFLAFDYGMMWKQLTEETPQGTARAYKQQQQHNELHHHPGEQDLTTHVCWDHLMQVLEENGFQTPSLRTQSRFFMEESQGCIESIVTASQTLTDKRKSQLLELITPGFFGQKFQVLAAIR